MKNILILGNSERQKMLSELLSGSHNVMHFKSSVTKDALEISDAVILPLPANDGNFISDSEIKISDIFGFGKKLYIGGRIGKEFAPYKNSNTIIDYTEQESFAAKNAVPTAEAAIMLALGENPFTINRSVCVISGYGRIGKALLPRLLALGATVYTVARSEQAREQAKALGATSISFDETGKIGNVDTVFNTVPHRVICEKELRALRPKLLIDLASSPGGCDFDAAKSLGIKAIHALALPGKHFPKTAAEITAETILDIINQQRNGDILNEQQ